MCLPPKFANMSPRQAAASALATPPPPPPGSQIAQQPARDPFRSASARRANGAIGALLSGSGGVDPTLLKLGKNKLLGQ